MEFLPDCLIHHIFSYLPLEDVLKTSLLCRRWRYAWTVAATHLTFDGKIVNRFRNNVDYTSFVDSILTRCISPKVKTFHLTNLRYNERVRSKLDSWLMIVKERFVEEIRLSFFSPFLYGLPASLYRLSSLASLEVSSCCFSLDGPISWPHLKFLSFENVKLSEDVLKAIFMGSPLLESLKLCECRSLKNIVIDAPSLKLLVLVSTNFFIVENIWAPHLLSLRVSGDWWPSSNFRLDNVSSLVEAQLDFVFPPDEIRTDGTRRQCYFVKQLLEKLCSVRTIAINSWCLQALSVLEMEDEPSLLSKCQNLILHPGISQWDLPGIAYMLRSSQCLEILDIRLTGDRCLKLKLDKESRGRFYFDEEDFWYSRKGNFQLLAEHLKRVEIAGLEAHSFGLKYLHALVKFVLDNIHVSEKVIIKVDSAHNMDKKVFKPMFFRNYLV
ncbi:hypothetical protein ACJRO7_018189 [Eucalyptus globulus]|uniref:F-box domain-containing protein n=1 Tax=Eucalyptus globulus TaxID=34317 RepID=A0ABD3KSW6_EUCGL